MTRSEPQPASGPGDAAGHELDERFLGYRSDVERLCTRLLGSPQDAGDAASESFLKARAGFDRYDPSRPLRPWLLSVTANVCIDRLRRRTREAQLFQTAEGDEAAVLGSQASPLERALVAERAGLLLDAIDTLAPRYRVPLVLRYFGDQDYADIAGALGVTRNQVATLLFRARQQLRARLSGDVR